MTSAEAKQRAALLEVLLERRYGETAVAVCTSYKCGYPDRGVIARGFAFHVCREEPVVAAAHAAEATEPCDGALRSPDQLWDAAWEGLLNYLLKNKLVPENVEWRIDTALEALS